MKRTLMTPAVLAHPSAACASQVAGAWPHGRWSRVIGGRAAQMAWEVVDDSQRTCSGDVCSASSGVGVRGRFRDGSGPWVKPIHRSAAGTELHFTCAGNNTRWFLRYDATRTANGNTVWRGNPSPEYSPGEGLSRWAVRQVRSPGTSHGSATLGVTASPYALRMTASVLTWRATP
ncbi:DUF6006 family protein [Deinococcus hopiensis]|uniref:Uncharacterized protein n=1 Tax=Deinococcus hopiensis KR-140 TaxID=695939 RepID=A0A1W1VV70_9DEIO|nr:DUF6006 family protein [Deinococcus hopiensis]SMB97226.1 hypothetical protein SAMN00790413_06425 [Deinococcus hopiensis KR-140]